MDFQLPCGRWRLHRGAGPRRPGAVAAPRRTSYRLCPGPNSKSFVAFVARQVPELGLDLPPIAIGKDYLGHATFVDGAPSGSGWQALLFGVAGVTLAREEGVERNLLAWVSASTSTTPGRACRGSAPGLGLPAHAAHLNRLLASAARRALQDELHSTPTITCCDHSGDFPEGSQRTLA